MRDRGVTLIELLVVVSLLAILSLLSYTGWSLQTQKARDAQRKGTLDEWKTALLGYYDDTGCFPAESLMICGEGTLDPYMLEIPCDPINNETYKYTYKFESCNIFYIYTRLEFETDSAIAKAGCEGGCGPVDDNNYNYVVTSGNVAIDGSGSGSGVEPTCGTTNKYCFPLQCGCCPGGGYRCNATGDWCLVDQTCSS